MVDGESGGGVEEGRVQRDPFKIEGPAVVSFSGGRTSGVMLHRLLQAGLQPDVHVLFANTGKERPETLDFVHEIETRWSVPIVWLEYRAPEAGMRRSRWAEVRYETASRNGEPFDALVAHRKRLPNPIMRVCTQELKIRLMGRWMRARGYEHWDMIVGLRADEPRRVARMRKFNDAPRERWTNVLPLAEAGVTEADVLAFWREQPFDLQLRTWEGNCDICFLKSQSKKLRIMQERPDLAAWWIAKEQAYEPFRRESRAYADLAERARHLDVIQRIESAPDDAMDCACTE